MPWAHNNPDFNLVETVKQWPVKPCRALEMGCGTGVDAIWLASQGFEVTACDASEIVIGLAEENLRQHTGNCHFYVLDCLNDPIPGAPFGFVFDRGYFHSYRTRKGRKIVAERTADLLESGGLWLTISGSADSPERDTGPPRLRAKDIIDAAEDYFRILSLKASYFGNEEKNPSAAWVCLLEKRT